MRLETILKQPSETLRQSVTFNGVSTISALVSVEAEAKGLVSGAAALDVVPTLFADALTLAISGGTDGERYLVTAIADDAEDFLTLSQIADEFDTEVGSFRTSIGVYKKKYRVSTTGYAGKLNFTGDTSATGKGLHNFDDDEAGAIAFATLDAIRDGGLKGMSAALQKAFASSDDLDKALEEALKVREVEQILGGLGSQLQEQFKAFEKQAKERVRVATEYGFDVVAIEKKNAEDRAKLVDQILSERIGSLQQLLQDIKFGDLFEGSLADQRQAVLAEIAKARTAAEAGEDGAADKLANLSRQLIELSRDAYGTAGSEYASDRSGVVSASEAVIQKENERIRAAQEAAAQSNAALQTIADNSTQQTDLLSQMVREIQIFGKTVTIPNLPAAWNVERTA